MVDCAACKKWKGIEERIKKLGEKPQYPTPEDVALYGATITGKVSMPEPTGRWHVEKLVTKEDVEREFCRTTVLLAKRKYE